MSLHFVIVTGEPRSGTSLAMETLKLLGVPIWGVEQPQQSAPDPVLVEARKKLGIPEPKPKDSHELRTAEKRKERINLLNEKFYEVGGIVSGGIHKRRVLATRDSVEQNRDVVPDLKAMRLYSIDKHLQEIDDHNGHAVKIITTGLIRSDIEVLKASKIIWCLRNPRHIALSQMNLESQNFEVAKRDTDNQDYWATLQHPFKPHRYLRGTDAMLRLLNRHPELKANILTVDYEDMHQRPNSEIQRMILHLGLTANDEKTTAAVKNVDPLKRRSSRDVQGTEDAEAWRMADELYGFTKDGNFEAATLRIQEWRAFQRSELAARPYLDTEDEQGYEATWWMILNPSVLKQRRDPSREVGKQMLLVKEGREQKKWLCDACAFYNRNGDSYSIPRPTSLGGALVRNGVDCEKMGKVTLESCQRHWETDERAKQVQPQGDRFSKGKK